MVWQDCMFACADYSLTDEFEKSIRLEITQNMRRLRHHASLALWCGNNEMEWQQDKGDYHSNAKTRSDYIQMFEYIIRRLAKENDPQTFLFGRPHHLVVAGLNVLMTQTGVTYIIGMYGIRTSLFLTIEITIFAMCRNLVFSPFQA